MSNILVTGGAGFVGVNLVPKLLELGHQVVVFDNESEGSRNNLPLQDIKFIRADIINADAVDAAVKDQDVIVHLAAATNVTKSIKEPLENFKVNVGGILNILEAMRKYKVMRIINASTGGAIIGDATPPVHEGLVPAPISPYGAAKLCAEGYLSAYAGSYGIKATSLRFSNVYGPRSYHKHSVVAHFIKQILVGETLKLFGGGSQTRDFIHVADICQGIVRAFNSDNTGVYQLGTNTPTSVLQLVEMLKEIGGFEYDVDIEVASSRVGEVENNYCSYTKAKKDLGFEPAYDLHSGLKETFDWFRQQNIRIDG